MHSLVIDGWPFYIGLSVLVIHMSFYWLNQWRKNRDKSILKDRITLDSASIPMAMILVSMHKKIQKLEADNEKIREVLEEICALCHDEVMDLHSVENNTSESDSSIEDPPPIVTETPNTSDSSSGSEELKVKKRYIVKR